MKNEHNVILIGMPGAGKSTVGVVLAKVLGYHFLDSDLVIQEEEKRLLSDIIHQDGIEEFIQIENRVNAEIMAEHTVIATGGSVVYGKEAMEHLQGIGTVVYIKLSHNALVKRLGNLKQRGVVLKDGQNLESLYQERCPLYEKYADIIVEAENMEIREVVQMICDRMLDWYA